MAETHQTGTEHDCVHVAVTAKLFAAKFIQLASAQLTVIVGRIWNAVAMEKKINKKRDDKKVNSRKTKSFLKLLFRTLE